ADLERELLFDLPNGGCDLAELAPARTATARDDAVRPRAPGPRVARAVEEDVARQQLVLRDRRGGDDRLRAVAAVLGADAALRIDEHVELHLAAEVRTSDAVRGVEKLEQLVVVRDEHRPRLAARQRLARERLVGVALPPVRNLQRHAPRHAPPPPAPP